MVKMLTTIIDGPTVQKPIPNKKIILRRSRDLPFYFIRGELSKSVLTALEYSTSYYVKDFERTMAYQIGDWNGKENLLYNSKSGVRYFPAGLLESIRGILDDFGVDYTVELPESKPLRKINVKWVSTKTLYPDQELAVEAGLTEPCGTICMPTGAGKTTVALKILSELKVKTLILVHRRELVKQWEKAIKLELGYEAGVVGSGVENWKDITIAMIPTLFRRKDLKLNHDLLILDECFPYETNVITDRGVLKIGEIVENALDVKVLTHTGAFKRILNHIRKPKPSVMVRVIHEFGSFECTETHKILTNKGWMESRRLLRGDVVYYTQDGKCAYVPSSCKYSGSYGLHEVQDDTGLYVYDIEVEDDHSYTANGVVVHNCHHTPARSAYKLSMACNAAYRFGLSATPHRPDGADLKLFAAVGGIIYKSTPEELVRLGRLARPEFMFLQTSYVRNIYQGMPFHKVYTLGITANEDRNNRITGIAEKLLSEGYIVYIHVEEVAHGRYLAGHIEGAEFVSGVTKKSDRDSIIGRFSSGKLKCLVSTLLGEGVDIPSITAIIMAGGKKTEIGCIQKIGRALRAAPGKEKAIIVDMMDKGIYLSDHWQERYKAYKEYYGVYCPDLKVG